MQEENLKQKKKRVFRVYMSTSFPHEVFDEIEKVARDRNMCNAEVLRKLCLRGLDVYRDDGELTAQASSDS
jgi:hypothetical protein